ncbi:hypothetical protein [Mycobacterium sp. C31M]
MKDRVDQLMQILADEHAISIPRQLIRAELSTYLTTVASLFRISRLDGRLFVTDGMLRASAYEITQAHTELMDTHDLMPSSDLGSGPHPLGLPRRHTKEAGNDERIH